MGERFTGITDEVFDVDLPFHYGGRVFDIRVVALTENGEPTGMYRPLITVDNDPLSHDVRRAESIEDAHLAAMKWIQTQFSK